MTWGGERLALVIHAPNCLVWTAGDSSGDDSGEWVEGSVDGLRGS